MFFLPNDAEERALYERIIERTALDDPATGPGMAETFRSTAANCGWLAQSVEPVIRQAFFQRAADVQDELGFERKLYLPAPLRLQNEIAVSGSRTRRLLLCQ